MITGCRSLGDMLQFAHALRGSRDPWQVLMPCPEGCDLHRQFVYSKVPVKAQSHLTSGT